mmetsp:Transcript_86996/g.153837  ORF Transcript_86996/g.153837 Transcript_86996/m.153837 type:complete len:237 (-) Transcript_86996:134-844(-)
MIQWTMIIEDSTCAYGKGKGTSMIFLTSKNATWPNDNSCMPRLRMGGGAVRMPSRAETTQRSRIQCMMTSILFSACMRYAIEAGSMPSGFSMSWRSSSISETCCSAAQCSMLNNRIRSCTKCSTFSCFSSSSAQKTTKLVAASNQQAVTLFMSIAPCLNREYACPLRNTSKKPKTKVKLPHTILTPSVTSHACSYRAEYKASNAASKPLGSATQRDLLKTDPFNDQMKPMPHSPGS